MTVYLTRAEVNGGGLGTAHLPGDHLSKNFAPLLENFAPFAFCDLDD